jgi:hypothetical protein
MLKILSSITLALLLAACKEGGSGRPENPMNPERPPPVVNPNPERGTLLGSGCAENYQGVKWFRYADGEGGSYSERDTQSEECGYIPIVLNVEIDNEYGDRFKPVVVTVDYTENGEPIEWDYEIGIGNAVKANANTLHIFGDGRLGEDFVTIEGERYTYTIREEPRCGIEVAGGGTRIDCQGYTYRGQGADGLIYYGEDDTQIVEWELVVVYNTNRVEGIVFLDESDPLWERSREKVESYNDTYERFGVHIRYRLTAVARAPINVQVMSGRLVTGWFDNLDADIIAGIGGSCPNTCGCAAVRTVFRENSRGLGMNSDCGEVIDLHEIGHAVGLAHGPDNLSNQASGYIFQEFGHGHSTPFCGRYTDLMSYASAASVINNSLQTCQDYVDQGWTDYSVKDFELDDPAGDRTYADSAYHMNRVRYDVSLINCHGDNRCYGAPVYREADDDASPVEGVDDVIKDDIDDIPMGRRMRDDLRRSLGIKTELD